MSAILIFVLILYAILIIGLVIGFEKVKDFHLKTEIPSIKFSVIIPFRNEAENLPALLRSIQALEYPFDLFEVLLVDDESTDNSIQIIQLALANSPINFNIINNERITASPKKDAISVAIKTANYEWIITTDADCELPKFWLQCFNNFIKVNNSHFVVAPVAYHNKSGWFQAFQTLDFISLQGATIGAFGLKKAFLCNGANLAYKKSLFQNLNGFSGNNSIASGDDVFLLQKAVGAKQYNIHFLKSKKAIVYTNPVQTFSELMSQRIRWASKATAYKSWFAVTVSLLVLAMNLALILSIVLGVLGLISVETVLVLWVGKSISDFLILFKTAKYFNQTTILNYMIISFLIYPFFNVVVAIKSFFKGYKWKHRSFSK